MTAMPSSLRQPPEGGRLPRQQARRRRIHVFHSWAFSAIYDICIHGVVCTISINAKKSVFPNYPQDGRLCFNIPSFRDQESYSTDSDGQLQFATVQELDRQIHPFCPQILGDILPQKVDCSCRANAPVEEVSEQEVYTTEVWKLESLDL